AKTENWQTPEENSLFGRLVARFRSSSGRMDRKLDVPIKNSNTRDVNEFGVDQFETVKVYYATCRNKIEDASGMPSYASERSSISYGYCDISIPIRVHKIGSIERPSIFRLEFRENSSKHITLIGMKYLSKGMFYKNMDKDSVTYNSESSLIFVHGYNVSHVGAARRAAQIKYDLDFMGPVTFFSWPSQSQLSSYIVDEQTIEWAESRLLQYLKEYLNRSRSQCVYLLAHSMGSRALTRALIKLYQCNPSYRERVKEVILAAPDIDRDVFVNDIAPRIVSNNIGITLYASSADQALAASEKIHGATRVGGSEREVAIISGIESIDATGVDTSFLGHSYFSGSKSVLSDMYSLINHNKRAGDRFGLRSVETSTGSYWKFLS
ncbi:alpha/beta hydrolase, partial [Granulosicoccus sp.]|nr:alpha/beta hydrolase [Granulosicoccus sp.]